MPLPSRGKWTSNKWLGIGAMNVMNVANRPFLPSHLSKNAPTSGSHIILIWILIVSISPSVHQSQKCTKEHKQNSQYHSLCWTILNLPVFMLCSPFFLFFNFSYFERIEHILMVVFWIEYLIITRKPQQQLKKKKQKEKNSILRSRRAINFVILFYWSIVAQLCRE